MEIPYEVTARRDTGLYNAKIGVWLFLASEVMLFGGLFSAYVFLRAGIDPSRGDIPWPVSVQNVWLGFINTLVLIASSVFVVLAWVSLKERNWRKFQGWMSAVLLCALGFLAIKSVEYKSKFSHHGIVMTDGSVLEGEVLNKTDRIAFSTESVTVNLRGGLPGFQKMVFEKDGEGHWKKTTPHLKDANGEAIGDFRGWFHAEKRRVSKEMAAWRRAYRRGENPKAVDTKAVLTADKPFTVLASPFVLVAHGEDSLGFRDGTILGGSLENDTVEFVVHQVDLQMVPFERQEDALAWEVVNDEAARERWFEARDAAFADIREWYESRGRAVPRKQLQSRLVSLHDVHLGAGHEGAEKAAADHPGDHGSEEPGEESAADSHDHVHAGISVPREKVKFLSAHTPRYHTYYAIYFTMTGLHGLHVIGGALVLAYFLFFGKKMFQKNPEHLANRVEVGGLFWHFVDLIWIFLFPIMYLL